MVTGEILKRYVIMFVKFYDYKKEMKVPGRIFLDEDSIKP